MSSSKRHFTAIIGKKEQGSYVSSSPSSAAKKAVSKLCADNKNRKVKFSIRETMLNSRKKTYGPYIGYMQKLEGRIIKYKPVAKLDKKDSKMKGGVIIGRGNERFILQTKIIYKNDIKYKQKGGMNCVNDRAFKNILGSCWMISIQMMMCFGDATKDQIERELVQPNTTIESISNLDKKLKKILPSKYICLETTKRIEYLNGLMNTFIKRYMSKIERNIPTHVYKDFPEENPYRCELLMRNNFRFLFQNLKDPTVYGGGGDILDIYFFAILFGIFFLKQEIYFSMHTRKMYNLISFDEQDIGIIITIKEHVCCFFVCGGVPKFYNDHDKKIYDFDFMNLLSNLEKDEDLFVIPKQVVALNRNEYFENIEKYTEYKKIKLLTVVSKNNYFNNFNQEIKLFFDEEYDEINNFYLLSEIGRNFLIEKDNVKGINTLKKAEKNEFYETMYILGIYFYNMYLKYPHEESYLDNAIEYYQKALDNGYNKAAEILSELYNIKGDRDNAIKYLKFEIYTR
jgi:hypothetical protein